MPLTDLQRRICRLLADRRRATGESYIAGGVALTEALRTARLSRDIDVFHDTDAALAGTWEADRRELEGAGFRVEPLRERPTFVEAQVSHASESVLMQWLRDSAFRFFPLIEHADLGLTLHPFDLATNKLLAVVGRVEVRDWVDLISCHEDLQPLGYLAWAASGKDPGLGPGFILEEAGRSGRYVPEEVSTLDFGGAPPDPAALSRTWREALAGARDIVAALPPERIGCCVLDVEGALYRGTASSLRAALDGDGLRFHAGKIHGAWPTFASNRP